MRRAAADRGSIVVAAALARRAGAGGHAWVVLQYLLGFRRLGWDVTLVDRAAPEDGDARGISYACAVLDEFGFGTAHAILGPDGASVAGLSRDDVLSRTRDAAFLLNVMGYLDDPEILEAARLRVFLDIDPGYPQLWRVLGLADQLAGHDRFVTIAERLGAPDCEIPTCGLDWITTRPPVVLEEWPRASANGRSAFTSVATWRGPYGVLELGGRTLGSRVHEFRRLAPLPRVTNRLFELALDIHPDETRDLELLRESGWQLVQPESVAADPASYRRYIQGSHAEFGVAKELYVATRGGWFSDRSSCYLASGKPVIAQDTGFSLTYPTGLGLLAYATLEEAAAAVEAVESDYPEHAAAARAIAEEHFDSDLVLSRLLAELRAA